MPLLASASGGQGPAQNGSVPQGEYIILLSVLQLSYDPGRVTPFCRGKQAQRSSQTCMKFCHQEVAELTLEPGLADLCCFFQPRVSVAYSFFGVPSGFL